MPKGTKTAAAKIRLAAPAMYRTLIDISDFLSSDKCPLCAAWVEDEGHDETCPGLWAEKAIEKARGET